ASNSLSEGGWDSGKGACKQHKKPSIDVSENPYGAMIPSFLWTEAIERGHEITKIDGVVGKDKLDSDIKMIFNLAGNMLINQHADINYTKKLLEDESKVEFIVVSDLFMTASAKYADLLLPGVSMFETNNISMPWAYSNLLGASNKVIEPLYDCRWEYDWMVELADLLGLKEPFSLNRTSDEWLEYTYNELRKEETELCDYDTFRKNGYYEYKNNKPIIAFEEQIQEHKPFPTESGKIEIFSYIVYRSQYRKPFPAIPCYVKAERGIEDPLIQTYPLQLIGYHTKRRAHSIHDENKHLESLDPRAIWMHPYDANTRNLKDGDLVEVYNDEGIIHIPVKITNRIIQGVCAMAQGAWHKTNEKGMDTNGSINTLTSIIPSPYSHGNGQHSILVEVKKVDNFTNNIKSVKL
ncbi:MAG: molybdopterin-dependent oxidoreductase, partial [Holdemanella sp.]|nr:molybdopterin-dependent oxidoreductase [Holdemanella sp.]